MNSESAWNRMGFPGDSWGSAHDDRRRLRRLVREGRERARLPSAIPVVTISLHLPRDWIRSRKNETIPFYGGRPKNGCFPKGLPPPLIPNRHGTGWGFRGIHVGRRMMIGAFCGGLSGKVGKGPGCRRPSRPERLPFICPGTGFAREKTKPFRFMGVGPKMAVFPKACHPHEFRIGMEQDGVSGGFMGVGA